MEHGDRRRIREAEAALVLPEFPAALGYLWQAYIRLRRRVPAGFAGPNPITWQDLDAFVRRTGMRVAPWEVELLEMLDDVFLAPESRARVAIPEGGNVREVAAASDSDGVKAIMGAIGNRRRVVRRRK